MTGKAISRRGLLFGWRSAPPPPGPAAPPETPPPPPVGAQRRSVPPPTHFPSERPPAPRRPSGSPPAPSIAIPEAAPAIAVIHVDACSAHRGAPCRVCYDVCPVAGAIVLDRSRGFAVPVAGESPCTGCRECDRACPSPGAITMADAPAPAPVRLARSGDGG